MHAKDHGVECCRLGFRAVALESYNSRVSCFSLGQEDPIPLEGL